jgi:hypothetical protein
MAIRSSIPFRNNPPKAEGRDPLRGAAFIPVQAPSALLYGHLPGFFFLLANGLNLVLRIGRDLLFGERQYNPRPLSRFALRSQVLRLAHSGASAGASVPSAAPLETKEMTKIQAVKGAFHGYLTGR